MSLYQIFQLPVDGWESLGLTLRTCFSFNRISLILGGLTIVTGLWQFSSKTHQDSLARYNQRFDNEPTIRKVTSILTECEYLELQVEEVFRVLQLKKLHAAEIELYYRFFEEMELGIQRGILKGKDVKRLFAYYAIVGLEKYDLIPREEVKNYWPVLYSFQERMKRLKPHFENLY